MKRAPSLVRRLWLASALVLPILIGFSAFTLNRAYIRSLDGAEYEALFSQIYALLATAETDDSSTGLIMPLVMANPRFETPESGLYARITDHQGKTIWKSNSFDSSNIVLNAFSPPPAGTVREHWFSKEKLNFRALSFTTIWEINEQDRDFTFDVIHSQEAKTREILSYQRSLLLWLGGMAVLLISLQVIVALWGLRPLKYLASEINKIEQGDSKHLDGQYPVEIQPVTDSLNKLLHSEADQRERYKNSLSDLAHSLKTPLSVIRSQLDGGSKDKLVDEQIERMSAIINHQLKRASAQVQTLYGPTTELKHIAERILNALSKVYREKNVSVDIQIQDNFTVALEEDDCMEVLGNMLENAFKYGAHRVKVFATEDSTSSTIYIEDDGPGIAENATHDILRRGARADTSTAGQGIGLAIAVDILSSYNGALNIDRSELGGASFRITLPKTRTTDS